MNTDLAIEESIEVRRHAVYVLAKNAYYNRLEHQSTEDLLAPIAKKYGYKTYRNVYEILLQKMKNDPPFFEWWKKSGKKRPRKSQNK